MGPPTGSAELNTSLPSYGRKSPRSDDGGPGQGDHRQDLHVVGQPQGNGAELATLIEEAPHTHLWLALSYTSWDEYCRAQFDIGEERAARPAGQSGDWFRDLAEAAGTSTKVGSTERATRAVGGTDLADVVEVVRAACSPTTCPTGSGRRCHPLDVGRVPTTEAGAEGLGPGRLG